MPKALAQTLKSDFSGEEAVAEVLFVLTNIVGRFDSLKFMLVLL